MKKHEPKKRYVAANFATYTKRSIALFSIMLMSFTVMAQEKLSGTVKDATGQSLIGVSVVVVGETEAGTVTDLRGDFNLTVPSLESTLQLSYLGYEKTTYKLSGQSKVVITMNEDSEILSDVVVVGYGTQKKVNLSGAVSAIKMDDLVESRPVTNISQGLAGLASGVSVNMANNRPGDNNATIRIRGVGTVNNSSPLVIIDGVEGDIGSVLPQDIENMSVLKDAASSAIYGARAANGVILITTKKGKAGAIKVNYNGYVSWESDAKNYKLITNYADYMDLINEGSKNSGITLPFKDATIAEWRDDNGQNPLKYPNSSVVDEMFSTSVATNHTLSVSGGSDKVRFFTSFGYANTPGLMENSGYERYSARANLEADVKPWLTIGTNLSGYFADQEIGTDKVEDVFKYGFATTPGMVFRAPDGRLGGMNNGEDDQQAAGNNPLYRINSTTGEIKDRNLKTRFYVTIKPVKGLSITGSFNYGHTNKEKWSKPANIDLWNFNNETINKAGNAKTSITNRDAKTNRYLMDVIGNYQNKVSKLEYNVMVGASQEQYRNNWFQAQRSDLLSTSIGAIDGAIGESTASGTIQDWVMRSYFGRINLSWDNKYLLEVNLRADASSRFHKDERWGYFPSVSAAWRIDQEPFMKPLSDSWLDNLKLRMSYGELGNNTTGSNRDTDGNYRYLPMYEEASYILNNSINMGLMQRAMSNPALSWETAKMFNVALDIGVFKNKLTATIDFFDKRTTNMIMEIPIPLLVGAVRAPSQNLGEMSNKGVEISLSWQDKRNDFSYFANANFTFLKNEVTKWKGDQMTLSGNNMTKEGYPLHAQYVLKVDRLIQTQADLDYVQSLIDNAPINPATGNKINPFATYKRPVLGDLLYQDLNKDGMFSDDDRVAIGNGPNPKFLFGFTLGAAYKGFDFSILLQGATGIKTIWSEDAFRPLTRHGYQISEKIGNGRWHEGIKEGTAKYPRLLDYSDTRNQRASDLWLQNRSYLKIRNIQLGYTLPRSVLSKLNIDKVRIYASLENFFTFTSFDGLDPEIAKMTYPPMKQAVVGINISF